MTRTLIACRGCDLLQWLPPLASGESAHCSRCGHLLSRRAVNSLDRALALAVAAAVLLLVANATPLLQVSVAGRTSATTIIGGAIQLWRNDERMTAAVVAFCVVLAPAAFVACLLTVLLTARRADSRSLPAPRWIGEFLRWTRYLHAWSLLEVMLLGLLVALVKIAESAQVSAHVGIFCVGALTFLFPAIMAHFDAREVWERIEWFAPSPALERSRITIELADPGAGSTVGDQARSA